MGCRDLLWELYCHGYAAESALMPLRTRIWETGRNFERCLLHQWLHLYWSLGRTFWFMFFYWFLVSLGHLGYLLYHAAWIHLLPLDGSVCFSVLFSLVCILELDWNCWAWIRQHDMRSLVYIYCQWHTMALMEDNFTSTYRFPNGFPEDFAVREYVELHRSRNSRSSLSHKDNHAR